MFPRKIQLPKLFYNLKLTLLFGMIKKLKERLGLWLKLWLSHNQTLKDISFGLFFNANLVNSSGEANNNNGISDEMSATETGTESYGTPPSSDGEPSQESDVTLIVGPGVYGIKHTPSGRIYYGETQELGIRLNRHKQALDKGHHENSLLQDTWDEAADPTQFQFLIYEWGPAWQDQNVRKIKEAALIQENSDNCFNTLPGNENHDDIRKPIMFNGQRFNSVREAIRILGKKVTGSRTNLKRKLNDRTIPNIYYLDEEPFGQIPVFAQIGKNGKDGPVLMFSSMGAVVDAGYATTTQMIRRRINSLNYPNWRYAAVDTSGKPVRQPYTLKPGEMSYDQWLEQQK